MKGAIWTTGSLIRKRLGTPINEINRADGRPIRFIQSSSIALEHQPTEDSSGAFNLLSTDKE
jgi:hypothetical protein